MSDSNPVDPPPSHPPTHPPTQPGTIPAKLDVQSTFVPKCLDCRYELSGLPDGRCPECGLAFTYAALKRLWQAKQAKKRALPVKVLNFVLLVAMFGPMCLVSFEEFWVLTAALTWYTLLLACWLYINRNWWIVRSWVLLFFLVVLFHLLFLIAATPIGLYAGVAIAAIAVIICWLALRWSPLVSSIMLLVLLVLPTGGSGLLMLVMSNDDLATGRHWSSFDMPTQHGWMAMPAKDALHGGQMIIVIAVVIAVITLSYARRAFVRLKAMSKDREDRPPPTAPA